MGLKNLQNDELGIQRMQFEERDEIKVYVKLPSWLKIETPIGSYNPDWAVVINKFEVIIMTKKEF